MTISPNVSAPAVELARVLKKERIAVASAFAFALEGMPRWKSDMDDAKSRWSEYLETQFFAFADYLAEYLRTGERTYKQLLLGEKIKSLYDPDVDDDASIARAVEINRRELEGIAAALLGKISDPARELLVAELGGLHRGLESKGGRARRVLLIGDCLFLDIVPFVVGDLLENGVRLVVDYATSKSPSELGEQLRKLSSKKFDLVFYSPFSYEFTPSYARLAEAASAAMSQTEAGAAVDDAMQGVRANIDRIADLYDCPVFVHNSAAIVREQNGLKRAAKLTLTARHREPARDHVNAQLAVYLAQKNAQSYKHLFLFDEHRIVQDYGEWRAGAFHYKTALQHPAVMGLALAPPYVDIILAHSFLATKKLVVSDLDNTLWDGVIGEGAVSHYHPRQQALKELKAKGVVLAVLSKNDPANVHWRGATLTELDFVHMEIGWGQKVHAMKRIQTELNLKTKDFVFIDDRADELELMRSVYPDMVCLDATDPSTWRRIDVWKELLDDELEMDRTLMYQQREKRKEFVVDDASELAEKSAMFDALGLKVTIVPAQRRDLKRVAELVNRTNQFNLQGSRTSFREVSDWHASPDHIVLTAQTSDRFGDMGTTCIAVARLDGDEMRIPIFVLSCRVFGYGVERSVLNHLKALAAGRGIRRLVARYVRTPQNAPCEDFLADNAFFREGDDWVFTVGTSSPEDEAWLTVEAVA